MSAVYRQCRVSDREGEKQYARGPQLGWMIDGDGSKSFTGGKLVIGFEVRNLFDIDPPYVNIAPSINGTYDATAANPAAARLP